MYRGNQNIQSQMRMEVSAQTSSCCTHLANFTANHHSIANTWTSTNDPMSARCPVAKKSRASHTAAAFFDTSARYTESMAALKTPCSVLIRPASEAVAKASRDSRIFKNTCAACTLQVTRARRLPRRRRRRWRRSLLTARWRRRNTKLPLPRARATWPRQRTLSCTSTPRAPTPRWSRWTATTTVAPAVITVTSGSAAVWMLAAAVTMELPLRIMPPRKKRSRAYATRTMSCVDNCSSRRGMWRKCVRSCRLSVLPSARHLRARSHLRCRNVDAGLASPHSPPGLRVVSFVFHFTQGYLVTRMRKRRIGVSRLSVCGFPSLFWFCMALEGFWLLGVWSGVVQAQ